MIARRELDAGILAAWLAASSAIWVSITLPWLRIVINGSLLTEITVTDLGWRSAVYVASVAVLVATALLAILARGVARYVAAGIAVAVGVVASVDVALILAFRHQITTWLGRGPAPGDIAVAELHSGGQPFGLVGVLVLLLVVLLAVSGVHRATVGLAFGAALTVGAFAVPWRAAWLIEDGSASYVTFGVLHGTGVLPLLILVVLVAVSVRSRSRVLIVVTWGVALFSFYAISARQWGDTPRLAWQQAVEVDEVGPQLALAAVLALFGATVSRWWRLRKTHRVPVTDFEPVAHPTR